MNSTYKLTVKTKKIQDQTGILMVALDLQAISGATSQSLACGRGKLLSMEKAMFQRKNLTATVKTEKIQDQTGILMVA